MNPPRRATCRSQPCALALALLAPLLLAALWDNCGSPGGAPLLAVTLNAIPNEYNDLLVVPPSGFTVDVAFLRPEQTVHETLQIRAVPFDADQPATELNESIVAMDDQRAVVIVSADRALPIGSYALVAIVRRTQGSLSGASLDFAVREHPLGPPLETPQWIQLDFGSDRDADGEPDFEGDLTAFGLGSPGSAAISLWVRDWVVSESVDRVQLFYDAPNPSALPGGDLPDVTFSDQPPSSGPFTRICVGGEDPTGGTVIGNVLHDPGNGNPSNVACDDFLPSGVFPRELRYYQNTQAFHDAFDPLLAEPVGTNPLDATVLGPAYDPSDPAQSERFQAIETAVNAFAQAVATVSAHEAGHALGMVAPGAPGGGLFGGLSGLLRTHNVDPTGNTPAENFLMNAGSSFSFAELAGVDGTPLPTLRELNFAYLHGRLVLDATVTGIYPPPRIESLSPTTISKSGPFMVEITLLGSDFQANPSLRLVGPLVHMLTYIEFVTESEMRGTAITGMLAPGTYDFEVTNPDGQKRTLAGAITVVP